MAKENQEYEMFVPSKELVGIIYDNAIKPTEKEFLMLKRVFKLKWLSQEELERDMKQDLLKIIEKEIYGLLTSFAKHCLYCSFLINGCATIAKDGEFVSWIFLDIIDRFELNAEKELSPVFDRLHSELVVFYSTPKQYVWGRVAVENGELKVFVNDNAFKPTLFPTN